MRSTPETSTDESATTETRFDESTGGGPDRSALSSTGTDLPLLDDEDVLVDAHPTWWAYALHLVLAGGIVLVGLLVGGGAGLGIVLVGAIVAGYAWYSRNRVRYLLTDRRIVVVTGFRARKTNETWMEDVRGMATSASAFGRHQGYGSITVSHAVLPQTFGRLRGLHLRGVPEYEAVAAAIRERQSARKHVEY